MMVEVVVELNYYSTTGLPNKSENHFLRRLFFFFFFFEARIKDVTLFLCFLSSSCFLAFSSLSL